MKPTANSQGSSAEERATKSQKARLWRHIIVFGLAGGIVITLLKWTEYRYLVIEHSIEIYGGLTAATFSAFGIWLGLRLTRKQIVLKEVHVPVPAGNPFAVNSKKREKLEITPRAPEGRRASAGRVFRGASSLQSMIFGLPGQNHPKG